MTWELRVYIFRLKHPGFKFTLPVRTMNLQVYTKSNVLIVQRFSILYYFHTCFISNLYMYGIERLILIKMVKSLFYQLLDIPFCEFVLKI